jgi:hypothetical protein
MSVTVQPGTYEGVTVGATIYEAPSGAVMCRMTIDINGAHLQGGICLVQKDGTLSERGFRDVQAIFGWSEWDWSKWDQDPEVFAGAAVQAVVETVQGEKSEFSSIRYVNPPGGGQRLEKANAKGLAARYGAKTRALFGGSTPVTAGGPAAPRPPAPPAPRPPPPQPQAATSTMEECWGVFCKRNDGKPELELYGLWADRVLSATGKTQNDCGPEDWGKLMESLTTDDLPY